MLLKPRKHVLDHLIYNPVVKTLPCLLLLIIFFEAATFAAQPYFSIDHIQKGKDFSFPILKLQLKRRDDNK
jgi:hypothetical protein